MISKVLIWSCLIANYVVTLIYMVVKMGRAHFPLFLLFTCAILTAKYVVTLAVFLRCVKHIFHCFYCSLALF